MVNLVSSWWPFWIPISKGFYKTIYQTFLQSKNPIHYVDFTRRCLKFGPIKTHILSWQPWWISDQHQFHKAGKGPPALYFCQVWLNLFSGLKRRRWKCEKLSDDAAADNNDICIMMTKAHMALWARWAKKDLSIYKWLSYIALATSWSF